MTNLEQLARIIQAESTWSAVLSDGYTSVGQNSPEHIAQAIIDAGWTPPVEPAPTTCADCGEPLTALNGDAK